jgi:hypothetical protein
MGSYAVRHATTLPATRILEKPANHQCSKSFKSKLDTAAQLKPWQHN